MSFPVFLPKMVEFLPKTSPSGTRVYVRSLCMVLYRAVTKLYPKVTLRIQHSIAHGYYCRLIGDIEVNEEVVTNLREEMRSLINRICPLTAKSA